MTRRKQLNPAGIAHPTRDLVTLVDSLGNPIGQMDKLKAHQNGGVLHLGFSILIFNAAGRILLQKRAGAKYHFANLWSNSCCGHPRPGEQIREAAARRLAEEFGFAVPLHRMETLSYQAEDRRSGLAENERLSVFIGCCDLHPQPDPNEIAEWKWENLDDLTRRTRQLPEAYTPWFLILVRQLDLQQAAASACSTRTAR